MDGTYKIIDFESQLKKIYKTNDIFVCYNDELDGGGISFSKYFLDYLEKNYSSRKFDNCLEWCSGPGFIGFSILSKNICNCLHFLDFYPPVEKCIELSKKINKKYSDRIFFYLSNVLESIPENIKFDLIVGNPPMYNVDPYKIPVERQRRYKDENWSTHKKFFETVSSFLTDDGVVLLIESSWGSSPNTFEPYINKNLLNIKNHVSLNSNLWMLEISKTKEINHGL